MTTYVLAHRRTKIVVLPDFKAELWPSMDLCAEQLARHWPAGGHVTVPPFRRIVSWLPLLGRKHAAFNVDRLLNRWLIYPLHLRSVRRRFHLFHVVDHSYAHLVHHLPAERTGVYCHDLDAFRSILGPDPEPRPRWFRFLARRILSGMQRAAVIFHNSKSVGKSIVDAGLIDPVRLIHAPLGVAAEFSPTFQSFPAPQPTLLHVGSCIPRKRIEVLLDVLAGVRDSISDVRLVKIGGAFTPAQLQQIERLHLADHIDHRTNVIRTELADAYRQATVVLQPSDAEGFGLPLIEALACGAPVLASDLPVLREVGGSACQYLPVGDVAAWVTAVVQSLRHPERLPSRDARLAQAGQYSWANHARIIAEAYQRL